MNNFEFDKDMFVKEDYKKGMKKQVAKSQIFTKSSLKVIQDEMRKHCIKSYNKFYNKTSELEKKQNPNS